MPSSPRFPQFCARSNREEVELRSAAKVGRGAHHQRASRGRCANAPQKQRFYAADLFGRSLTELAGLLSSQAQMRDRTWFLRQRGQKIDVFVLGRLLKLVLSTSTPVETWCPVVGHTKIKVPKVAS